MFIKITPFLLWAWHFPLLKLSGIFISYIWCHVKWSGSHVLQHMLNKISIYESHVNDISLFHDYFGIVFLIIYSFLSSTHNFHTYFFILHHLKSSSHQLIWNHYSSLLINLIKWVKMFSRYHYAYKYSPNNLSKITLLQSQ